MDVGAHSRRARAHAAILCDELELAEPNFRDVLDHRGPIEAIRSVLGLSVRVDESTAPGCSVAGSCDKDTGAITVVRAAPARMQFTALHELAHVRGYTSFAFQGALDEAAALTRRDVEEDACEAFAASMLLPDDVVDTILGGAGVTPRGLGDLIASQRASREACAVALAHRMQAPGYVMLLDSTGVVQFAARSGDVLPIARGTDQRSSVLGRLGSRLSLRERGSLAFRSGALTDPLYVEARRDNGLVLVVASTDNPGWPILQAAVAQAEAEAERQSRRQWAWCAGCELSYPVRQICSGCDEPIHFVCRGCGCDVPVLTPAQVCDRCFLEKPATLFVGSATTCQDCLE